MCQSDMRRQDFQWQWTCKQTTENKSWRKSKHNDQCIHHHWLCTTLRPAEKSTNTHSVFIEWHRHKVTWHLTQQFSDLSRQWWPRVVRVSTNWLAWRLVNRWIANKHMLLYSWLRQGCVRGSSLTCTHYQSPITITSYNYQLQLPITN